VDEVTILGLFSPDVAINTEFKGQVWSLTDWYRPYPWLPKLDRLYEVHGLKHVQKLVEEFDKHNRYPGNFKEHFENCGGTIVVDDEAWVEYLDADVELLDYDKLKSQYPLGFTSSIDVMMIDAIDMGFDTIHLEGVMLMDDIHNMFIKSILNTIDHAREQGIEITAIHEQEWRDFRTDCDAEDYIQLNRNKR
jgi:hypothetical protein